MWLAGLMHCSSRLHAESYVTKNRDSMVDNQSMFSGLWQRLSVMRCLTNILMHSNLLAVPEEKLTMHVRLDDEVKQAVCKLTAYTRADTHNAWLEEVMVPLWHGLVQN